MRSERGLTHSTRGWSVLKALIQRDRGSPLMAAECLVASITKGQCGVRYEKFHRRRKSARGMATSRRNMGHFGAAGGLMEAVGP
jgi:hypothetical protein